MGADNISMVEDRDAQEAAAYKADEIIKELRGAALKGGFDNVRMVKLTVKWTELGMLARGSGYLNTMAFAWRMTFQPNFNGKTSQELLNRMIKLDDALGKHLDIKYRSLAFTSAEDAMRALVYQYRMNLKERGTKDLIDFDGLVRSSMQALSPDFYKTRGD